MSKRTEFPKSIKLKRFEYAKGKCEQCLMKILGSPEYDHALEDYVGGPPTFENCRCYCKKCHGLKTQEQRPEIDKTRAVYEKRAGVRKTSRGFRQAPDGYDPWNRRMREE